MSQDESTTPESVADAATETTPVAEPPPVAPTPDPTAVFMEAYDCAKNNYHWLKVASAVRDHPEWLIQIPQGRKWTMLHQIVFCGNIAHLNEVLSYQVSNENFSLLFKAMDDKTIREVASERAHVYPQMTHYVERLVALDQLLHNAKEGKWALVRQFLQQKPGMVNEKPPHQKIYLIHRLAATGQLEIFQELRQICPFQLDLVVEEKTISQIARENNHEDFAAYVESLPAEPIDAAAASAATSQSFFSHTFDEDPGITIFPGNPGALTHIVLTQGGLMSHPHLPHQMIYAAHGLYEASHPIAMATTDSTEASSQASSAQATSQTTKPPMTPEEQAEYEAQITANISQFSSDNLLSAVTCSITKSILRDPVVAADGFTYEREYILKWFEQSTRSPMTNQELDSLELKPNHAIKSILQAIIAMKNTSSSANKSVSDSV